jgi:hypothetical protein
MWSLKRWLARLSFSFLILAGLCGYTAYGAHRQSGWTPKPVLLIVAGIGCFALGMIGTRIRHEMMRKD